MLKLLESPQFKADYKRYQEQIKSVEDEKTRNELTAIFLEFVESARLIDRYHGELMLSNRIDTGISDARSKLAASKKKLDSALISSKLRQKNQA